MRLEPINYIRVEAQRDRGLAGAVEAGAAGVESGFGRRFGDVGRVDLIVRKRYEPVNLGLLLRAE